MNTEDDLTPRMQGMLAAAYAARERAKCSREDFADGYIAALIDLRSKSSFKAGRWMLDDSLPWEA